MEALEALNLILIAHLRGNGAWGDLGYPQEVVRGTVSYPYCVWFPSGHTPELQAVHVQTARMQMSVKGVCGEQDGIVDAHGLALTMQGQLTDLLLYSGSQDTNSRLPSQSIWEVLTVTQGRMIYQPVQLSETSWSYHAGHVWEFLMERK